MTTRMAALLLLRRLAAGGAVARLQQPYAGLATAASRQDALDATREESGQPDKGNKNRWMELPPFAPVDAAAAARAIFRGQGGDEIEGSSNSTAIRWVRRCCPDLPASLVQKLFRLRKVKKNAVTAETSSTHASAEQFRLRRVSAKDHLLPGDTLFLPVNIQESSVAEKARKFDNRNEIDFLRSLEIYKDKAIIVVNKPPGMPVQGGVGIKNSIDVLAPMFEENSSDAPRLGTQQVLQRKYVALVMGTPRHPKGLLSAPLAKVLLQDGKSERLTVRAGPNTTSVQDALTEYRVIESCPQGFTWLELFPLTGRKHQLRVHCAEVLGTPIVGDYKYGRQAHQDWTPLPVSQTVDKELLRKQRLPFGLVLGGGSIAEQQPQLHLHCKQMMLPDISAAVQGLQSEDADRDFSDLEKLSFVAPLPLHMRLSWEVLKSVDK
ncbi:RNA pseudouridine synthase 4, mitochondrial isoform X2 [Hordeum vulgare subsp. vulgare]|uniref:RNA pseudouridine synthase 4, mitochondrial isoform X2 n=1 Tax=Hordeum vulgare subsp. vulgare TaxID=112509 RepID=UPI000B47046D|nr:RNA pseudouridine synthase 4, mitochondrial isoform X2 [Hordeum vulgare subsp. vulgare]